MNDLSADAALIADASLIVRARFVEAADSFAHVSVRGVAPSTASGFWPAMTSDQVDGEYRERYRPSSAAISRMEEVMQGWLLDHVAEIEHRILIVRWSACLAVPRMVGSFRSFCKKTGRNRTTAERRMDVAFSSVASRLLKGVRLLHEPDWSRVMPMLPDWGTDIDMVAERVAERVYFSRSDDAKPTDQPEIRDFSWAEERNEARRKRAVNG
jgi:hypothetical protein